MFNMEKLVLPLNCVLILHINKVGVHVGDGIVLETITSNSISGGPLVNDVYDVLMDAFRGYAGDY